MGQKAYKYPVPTTFAQKLATHSNDIGNAINMLSNLQCCTERNGLPSNLTQTKIDLKIGQIQHTQLALFWIQTEKGHVLKLVTQIA